MTIITKLCAYDNITSEKHINENILEDRELVQIINFVQ